MIWFHMICLGMFRHVRKGSSKAQTKLDMQHWWILNGMNLNGDRLWRWEVLEGTVKHPAVGTCFFAGVTLENWPGRFSCSRANLANDHSISQQWDDHNNENSALFRWSWLYIYIDRLASTWHPKGVPWNGAGPLGPDSWARLQQNCEKDAGSRLKIIPCTVLRLAFLQLARAPIPCSVSLKGFSVLAEWSWCHVKSPNEWILASKIDVCWEPTLAADVQALRGRKEIRKKISDDDDDGHD